ncbi:hypothetical protein N7517_003818 [Penicillium concentricum]|uniref:Uncharacterized protein n=1 Tax=Penicillium concentricum TaxID=293559 RepID=A0A9W9S4E3_9EURO|nr:uncharacterized protein N7517_003818 [Penicillium concentricum]KAJ5371812.1 hypothetical protein N7517_003818 [Penicillium concentricum]
MSSFFVTPVTVLTEDVETDVMIMIGRVVDSDDPLLPGGVVEVEPPEVEEEDDQLVGDPYVEDPYVEDPDAEDPAAEDPAAEDPAVEDPAVDDVDVVEPNLGVPEIDVLELEPIDDDIPAEIPGGALDPGVPEGVVVCLPVPVTGVDIAGLEEATGLEEERGTFVKL